MTTIAGLRISRKCRKTKTLVSLYDGRESELDTSSGRWQTVCEDHGTIISHRTYKLAQSHLSHPDEWCEYCQEELNDIEEICINCSKIVNECNCVTCPACNGKPYHRVLAQNNTFGYDMDIDCDVCDGIGKLTQQDCIRFTKYVESVRESLKFQNATVK